MNENFYNEITYSGINTIYNNTSHDIMYDNALYHISSPYINTSSMFNINRYTNSVTFSHQKDEEIKSKGYLLSLQNGMGLSEIMKMYNISHSDLFSLKTVKLRIRTFKIKYILDN